MNMTSNKKCTKCPVFTSKCWHCVLTTMQAAGLLKDGVELAEDLVEVAA